MFCRERWLLCALVLLGSIAGGRSELQYVLTSPASLSSGEPGKACVFFVGNKEKLDVGLMLQHDGKNITIISEDVSSSKYFQCADYKVPNVAKAVPVALLLSVKGQTTEILERKTAVIKPNKNNCIFQMDKPIYQPQQQVHFRIICLDPQLKAVNEVFTSVYLRDPTGTKIKHWSQQETKNGVVSFDFQLIKEAPVGSYSILAERKSSYSLSQWFRVEEYVPPRFSVTVDAPDTISALDTYVGVSVAAHYVYGEPVPGTVTMLYCKQPSLYGRRLNCLKEKGDLCSNMTGKLDTKGVYKSNIDMTGRFMGLTGMSMRLDVIVTEQDTEIQVSNSRYLWVTTQPARINVDYSAMNQYYKRGIPYAVKAQLVDEKNNPIPKEDIEIEVDQKLIHTVKTDADGKIDYAIDTSDMVAPNFTVRMSYKNPDQCYYAEWRDTDYPTAEHTAYRFYSQSGSFIQAKPIQGELKCGESRDIEVQYSIGRAGLPDKIEEVIFAFMHMARGRILQSTQKQVDLTSSLNGSISIPVTATAEMAPSTNIVVLGMLKGEIIADVITLEVEKCFKNNVGMTFSAEKGLPGSTAEVILSGDPNSICGLKVIDSSLLLMNSYDSFSPDNIYNMFSYWSYGYNIEGFNVEDPEPPCLDPKKLFFFEGKYYYPASTEATEGDSYGKLKEAGLILATKLQTRKPNVCSDKPRQQFKGGIYAEAAPHVASVALKTSADRAVGFGGGAGTVETFRTNFSDSFMWFMVPLDKDGHASLSEKVPDTITEWKGTAFCLSDKGGFGMTKYAANYTTYLPFFMELSLPYSFFRGETLVVTGVVRNYLDDCVKVQVDLEPSNAFTAELKEGTQNACVCSKGQVSHSWLVQAKTVGKIPITVSAQTTFIGQSCDGPNDASKPSRKDTVVQTIISEPEGIPQQMTLSNLIFVKPGMKSTVPIQMSLPSNVVPDSMSAHISAVGDLVGLPLKNLEDLVGRPYGCAEQNLAKVAPIIWVLDYLNATGQLSDEILQKGKQYMLEGYLRHLGYAAGEAYKLFRSSDQPNSWLTVYSFKTFEQAKRYIEIDETRQQQTLIWLENHQKLDNGCFEPTGSLFTFRDTNSSLRYTAYVVVALLETKYSLGKTMLEGAMECLKAASKKEQKIGDEVLMLYAFTLAGLAEYRDPLMAKLMKKAIVKDGLIHWEREEMPNLRPVPFFFPIYYTPEIEITSYMLLSMLGGNSNLNAPATAIKKSKRTTAPPAVSEKLLTTAAQVSLWLTRQQNLNGGFPSTPDTVVGLQALTAFGKVLYTPNSQQNIRIKQHNQNIGTLKLDSQNRLQVQRFDLPDVSSDYSMEIDGNGWSMIQIGTTYNIPIPKENSAFSLSLSTASDTCVNGVTKAFNITVTLSYHGPQNTADITMLQIRMLSGYMSDYWSLKELENNKVISRFETNPKGELLIYLQSITKESMSFTFRALMDKTVLNVKTSSAIIYECYNPAENGYASYEHPCVKHE